MRKGNTGSYTSGHTQHFDLDAGTNDIQVLSGMSVRVSCVLRITRPREIVVSQSTLAVTEENSDGGAYTVRLSIEPIGGVWVRAQGNSSAIEIFNPGVPFLGIAGDGRRLGTCISRRPIGIRG